MNETQNKNKQMQISIDTENKAHENKSRLSPFSSNNKNNLTVDKNNIHLHGWLNTKQWIMRVNTKQAKILNNNVAATMNDTENKNKNNANIE